MKSSGDPPGGGGYNRSPVSNLFDSEQHSGLNELEICDSKSSLIADLDSVRIGIHARYVGDELRNVGIGASTHGIKI
jgi:hypothetical protein